MSVFSGKITVENKFKMISYSDIKGTLKMKSRLFVFEYLMFMLPYQRHVNICINLFCNYDKYQQVVCFVFKSFLQKCQELERKSDGGNEKESCGTYSKMDCRCLFLVGRNPGTNVVLPPTSSEAVDAVLGPAAS